MTTVNSSSARLRKMIAASLFVAVSYLVRLVVPPIQVLFLTFEFKDSIIAIGAMYLGPLWAVVMSALVALLEFVTVSSTGWYGLIMNFMAATAFTAVASLIYRFRRTMAGAVIGLCSGVLALVAVMLPMNLVITPFYYGMTVGEVAAWIPKLLLPFNLAKGAMNAGVVLLLYKPVTAALYHANLLERSSVANSPPRKNRTWVMVLLALAFIALSLLVFFAFLHGKFTEVKR